MNPFRWIGAAALCLCSACASDGILAPENAAGPGPDAATALDAASEVDAEASAASASATVEKPVISVRSRCFSSFGPRPDPLYIVDGVLVRTITTLRPEDIVSIEVIKGATAASLYGERAEHRVVTVTTRNAPVRAAS